MADDNDILIDENGSIRFVYSDLLDQVFEGEQKQTARASHVEPAACLGGPGGSVSGWAADMRPSGGPVLYAPDGEGFTTRQAALDAERAWLRRERGL